jgi:perosamine synthetase
MTLSALAIFGGEPVCGEPWPEINTIGPEEKRAVNEVLDSGVLSAFRGTAGPDFLGGPAVRKLEAAWAEQFEAKHAISFNSLTSGLIAAIGALRIGPGDEVIVPPYTMQATATCVLMYGAVPVFGDIHPKTCCIDPASIEARITPRTKAIIAVHLFGHPANMPAIMDIADRHNLMVIEDIAQAPGGRLDGKWLGQFGDIGGFSLNYHKTIHSGEGGVMVTDNDDLALRMQLIRNHGEAVAADMGVTDFVNTFGGNLRMTEMEAAVAREQLKKLETLTKPREDLARHLDRRLTELRGIRPWQATSTNDRHVYYFYAMHYDAAEVGIPRELFVEAVQAEGIELRQAYVKPIYLEPLFQNRVAFKSDFPFVFEGQNSAVSYQKGLCPVTEDAYENSLMFGKFCQAQLTEEHVDQVIEAMAKVLAHTDELKQGGGAA